MWCHIIWYHVMSYVIICDVMSYHVMSCHIMSCDIMSCHMMWCYVISCYVMWCHVIRLTRSGHVMSFDMMWCHVMSCDISWCHIMSCVWCHVKWCHLAMTFSFCFIFGPNKSLYIYHVFYGFSKYLILRKLWILLWTWTRNTSYIFYTFVDNTQHTLLNWVNRKWYCETGRDVTKQSLVLIIEFLRQ